MASVNRIDPNISENIDTIIPQPINASAREDIDSKLPETRNKIPLEIASPCLLVNWDTLKCIAPHTSCVSPKKEKEIVKIEQQP